MSHRGNGWNSSRFYKPLCGFLLLCLPFASGCRMDRSSNKLKMAWTSHLTLKTDDVHPFTDGSGRQSAVPVGPASVTGAGVNIIGAAPNPGDAPGDGNTRRGYYVVYADIYWKLNYIREQLIHGKMPRDLKLNLTKVRSQLEAYTATAPRNENYTVAAHALSHFEAGIAHYAANQELLKANTMLMSAPWGSGSSVMQQYIDSGGLGFGSKSIANTEANALPLASGRNDGAERRSAYTQTASAATLTYNQSRAVAIILSYADRYGRSPADMSKDEWQKGIADTNKLRTQLWRLNHIQTDDSAVSVDMNAPVSDTSLDTGSSSAVFTTTGTDLPTGSAPIGDPFSARLPTPSR